jgi:hypothetical protein
MKIKHLATSLAAVALAASGISLKAQVTNFVAYNFDTDQVTGTPYGTVWNNWFGGAFTSVAFDSSNDASNNPASGSMKLSLTWPGGNQYVLYDGFGPSYAPLDLTVFTNLSFDIRYDISSAIRTNNVGAGVNGSLGTNSLDFGYMRIGSKSQPSGTFGQDWYYYFAISATNGLGNPNTNWNHVSINLTTTAAGLSDLQANGLADILIGMDGGGFGNSSVVGAQIIWFDNIQFNGFVAPAPPPALTISKPTPALRMFGGSGQYGRSQITMADNNESWISGPYPISYSFTLLHDATNFPSPLDTHLQILSGANNYSGYDYTGADTLWLQIIAGGNPTNTSCVARLQWKTNLPNNNPPNGGVTELTITNPVRAGTWTLTFLSDTNGTLTAPGASPAPFQFTLGNITPADSNGYAADLANFQAAFANPVQIRFGLENNGAPGNGGIPDDWANISVSGTAGLSATNRTEDFTKEGTNQLDTTFWNLATSDGANVTFLVPTNAPYWITWKTPDTGFALATAPSVTGPWHLPEFYNSYTDGTNAIATQTTQAKVRWNLMMPWYLPTADGSQGTNQTVGGPLSPNAFFLLQNPPVAQ